MIAWVAVGWALKLKQGNMTKREFLEMILEETNRQVGENAILASIPQSLFGSEEVCS